MITRKEYMSAKSPFEFNSLEDRKFEHKKHCDYYRQFAKIKATDSLLADLTKRALYHNKIGSSLNEIQLKNWDRLHYAAQYIFDAHLLTEASYPNDPLYNRNTGKVVYAMCDTVCIAKLIVRDYLLANGYVEIWEKNKYNYFECFLVKKGANNE